MKKEFVLDGFSLSPEQLYEIGYGHIDSIKLSKEEMLEGTVHVALSEDSKQAIQESRKVIDEVIRENRTKYGINTGFGNFASVKIGSQNLSDLQKNLIRSHSSAVGTPLTIERARMLQALRVNVLAKGYSGIRLETVEKLVAALNKSCISKVPSKGSVGASGDLAPLSHIALGMMGEGEMWNPNTEKFEPAAQVLKQYGIEPIDLAPKEGLALINGTQFICALGTEALVRAKKLALQADIVSALTMEALFGSHKVFDARIHNARPHKGQIAVAKRMRALLLEPVLDNTGKPTDKIIHSEIAESHRSCNRVQDAYTLRCIPQVHGIVHDTIGFVDGILTTELNSATDNPIIFADKNGSEIPGFEDNIVSGGNFHGEYPAKAMDYLAIGIAELANMSERRTARLVDQSLSNLPAFLVEQGGLNSGFMIAHVTAAALTSENKVLVHPASCDTLSTSANKEDHVSMGPAAALKAIQVVENVEYVVAVELLAACQALDFARPLKTTRALEQVHALVRKTVSHYDKDRYMTPDIEHCQYLLRTGQILRVVEESLGHSL